MFLFVRALFFLLPYITEHSGYGVWLLCRDWSLTLLGLVYSGFILFFFFSPYWLDLISCQFSVASRHFFPVSCLEFFSEENKKGSRFPQEGRLSVYLTAWGPALRLSLCFYFQLAFGEEGGAWFWPFLFLLRPWVDSRFLSVDIPFSISMCSDVGCGRKKNKSMLLIGN